IPGPALALLALPGLSHAGLTALGLYADRHPGLRSRCSLCLGYHMPGLQPSECMLTDTRACARVARFAWAITCRAYSPRIVCGQTPGPALALLALPGLSHAGLTALGMYADRYRGLRSRCSLCLGYHMPGLQPSDCMLTDTRPALALLAL